ncbi:MAG: M56 family metallopeptidase, partial [Rubricoccaceae bacterium]|nr:M56 family metallopeptidase [Rubricoccaceae bacterium]
VLAGVAGTLVVLVALVALAGLARLAADAVRLRRLRRSLAPAGPAVQARLAMWHERLGLHRPVRAVVAPAGVAPFTLGWRRPVVALPEGLTGAALDAALTHELAHVARADFAWHAAQRVVVALCRAHPLVPVLARGLDLDRERAADAAVLTHQPSSRRTYADLLLTYATLPPPAFTLGILPGSSSLKHRIDAMYQPLPNRIALLAGRALAAAALTLVAALAVVASAPSADAQSGAAEAPVFTVVDEMPEMVGGLEAFAERLTYPQIARLAGIEGRVLVQFVVDAEGAVRDATVIEGVHEALDAAALDAVEGSAFTPGRQRGEAVKVQLVLPVTFKLPPDEE